MNFGRKSLAITMMLSLSTLSCSVFERQPEAAAKLAEKGVPLPGTRKTASIPKTSPLRRPELMVRLKTLENKLASSKELEQYSKVLPYMSVEERIRFLETDGFEDRQDYLKAQNFPSRPSVAQESMKDLVEAQDIAIDMPQTLVRRSWGEPDSVEVSGNPQFRNERWRYNKYVSTPEGFKMEKKVVYFEAGKVVGWEVE